MLLSGPSGKSFFEVNVGLTYNENCNFFCSFSQTCLHKIRPAVFENVCPLFEFKKGNALTSYC